MEGINWISLLLASIVPMVMGFIWYHKAVFGKAWMECVGMTEEDAAKSNMPMIFGISLILSALLSFFFIHFNNGPGQEGQFDSFGHGAFHGAFIGIVVVMPVFITNGLFEHRTWKHMFINLGYWIITMAIMGGIVDAMHHWPNEGPM